MAKSKLAPAEKQAHYRKRNASKVRNKMSRERKFSKQH